MMWRRARAEETALGVLWMAAALAGMGLRTPLAALAWLAPGCPFHALFGVPCAACGSTRAVVLLLQGRVPAALAMNPLAATGGLLFLAGGLAVPVWLVAGRPVAPLPAALPARWRAALWTVLIANWSYLIVRGM
jgi:hypothetical protein